MAEIDDELWSAIADPSRRAVLDLLLMHGKAGPTALSEDLPLTRQAVSKHLAVLERVGVVTATRSGREVLYEIRTERLDEASELMSKVATRWESRLLAIKRLAEAAEAERKLKDKSQIS